ncbi:MAG TPA: M56 family metallopeptidase [Bacteroidaceae bacterium]|nr:M56 family metallopeptidase [Bacteroidaceae bacterium]
MMHLFISYFLWVNVSLAVLYTAYCILIRSQVAHHFNRVLLWVVVALSFLLPLLPSGLFDAESARQQFSLWLPDVVIGTSIVRTINVGGGLGVPLWEVVLLILFLIGASYFALSSCLMYVSLYKKIRSGQYESLGNGLKLIRVSHLSIPFSWYRYIVVSDHEDPQDLQAIILHERAHILLGHTLDLLLLDVLLILFWCNPVVWLIKRDLQDLHEYEADQYVINQGIDAIQYQLLLVTRSTGSKRYALANSLNHSSLKKRIIMMQKQKNETLSWRKNALKIVGLFPVVALMALVISCNKQQDTLKHTEATKVELQKANSEVQQTKTSNEVFNVAEVMPTFTDGGMAGFMSYLSTNIKYPESAQKAGKEGRVIVQFIVSKTGEIINPVVVRSVDPALDAEAIRVISTMPAWTPGEQEGKKVNVKYTVPVSFKLK